MDYDSDTEDPDDPLPDSELTDDLELEAVDPEILQHKRQRTQRKIREVEDRVDIDELIAPKEHVDPYSLDDFKKFRFSIRHLMIATAVCALLLTLFVQFKGACMPLFVGGCAALGTGWWLVLRKEREQTLARQKLGEQMKARIAAQRAAEDGRPIEKAQPAQVMDDVSVTEPKPAFTFSFSMKQLMVTFTIVAVALGLAQGIGGADNAALMLGFIALLGLAVHAAGFDPPPIVVLGWWMLLVLYLFVGLIAAVTKSDKAAFIPAQQQSLLLVDALLGDPSFDVRLQHVERDRSADEHCVMKAADVKTIA